MTVNVGRIEVYFYGAFVWSGSGALVGTNVVLTASHMVQAHGV